LIRGFEFFEVVKDRGVIGGAVSAFEVHIEAGEGEGGEGDDFFAEGGEGEGDAAVIEVENMRGLEALGIGDVEAIHGEGSGQDAYVGLIEGGGDAEGIGGPFFDAVAGQAVDGVGENDDRDDEEGGENGGDFEEFFHGGIPGS